MKTCIHPLYYTVNGVCLACSEARKISRERDRIAHLEVQVLTLQAELLMLHARDAARARTPNTPQPGKGTA